MTQPIQKGHVKSLINHFDGKDHTASQPKTYPYNCPKRQSHPSIINRSSSSTRTSLTPLSPSLSPDKISWLKIKEIDTKTKEAIHRHRNPTFTDTVYKDTSLSNHYAADKLASLIKIYKLEHNGKSPDPRALAHLKEQATQWAFDEYMQKNVQLGLYNPGISSAELQSLLEVTPEPPFGKSFTTKEDVMEGVEEELQRFSIPKFEKKTEATSSKKTSQVLTIELHDKLKKDIEEIFDLYNQVYPNAGPLKTFMFCRDLVRVAVYQVIFDKTIFTGSDHGVLHIHHNISNSDSIVKGIQQSEVEGELQENDVTIRQQLLIRIMHFYHDTGYTVGATDFNVKKDHPFIGAEIIETHRAYFEYYLDKEATDVLKTAILYHAIVSFDVKVGNDLSMVRFITSNADACAVAADEKSQSFWRENPQAIQPLIRLRTFLGIYPEMAKKLSHPSIITAPHEVFALENPQKPLTEDNFKNPVEWAAWSVFSKVKAELIEIANHETLPEEEKFAFIQAIQESFNAFSGDIVLSQYGAALQQVSAVLNTEEKDGPKYKSALDIAPSLLFSYLEALCSKDLAAGNIRKLCCSEYAAKTEDVNRLIDQVGLSQESSAKAVVPSPVAQITISKLASSAAEKKWIGNVQSIEAFLKRKLPNVLSAQTHHEFLEIIQDEKSNLLKKGQLLLKQTNLLGIGIDTKEKERLVQDVNKILLLVELALQTPHELTKEEQTRFELMLKTACSLNTEWEEIGVPRPLFN